MCLCVHADVFYVYMHMCLSLHAHEKQWHLIAQLNLKLIRSKCKADKKQASNGITEEEYDQICKACDEVLFWLDDNQEATRSEVAEKKQTLEDLCSSIHQ